MLLSRSVIRQERIIISISVNVILNKIQKEITQAKQAQDNSNELRRHVSNIHVLCELILDNDTSHSTTKNEKIEQKHQQNEPHFVRTLENSREVKQAHTEPKDSIFDF
ncbi:DUF5327 family protein [Virgibacillus sp. W0430]|uniref:DUF5327 family protein n=1 Tax=Virgibacillus sp. W0430 TaxID=3391580 RepID=UPI003F487099